MFSIVVQKGYAFSANTIDVVGVIIKLPGCLSTFVGLGMMFTSCAPANAANNKVMASNICFIRGLGYFFMVDRPGQS